MGTRDKHPAVQAVLEDPGSESPRDVESRSVPNEFTTSLSLSRALAVGLFSRLDESRTSLNIWNPAVGPGFAASMVVDALQATGVHVSFRGQDINRTVVAASRDRFQNVSDADFAVANTLVQDEFDDFSADLALVHPPWGADWREFEPEVQARQASGTFKFGLTSRSDSTWLFISLALEKLRPAAQGGGRVAALVHPAALRARDSASVRRRIVEAGLLESVTRLPEGLDPATSIPVYLLTFSNTRSDAARTQAMIADLQAQFRTENRRRVMPVTALGELESGLRTGKPGPRNRNIATRQFTRRDAVLSRTTGDGRRVGWPLTVYNDTPIDSQFLESRYGQHSGVMVDGEPRETLDLDPGPIFGDGSQELLKDLTAKGWPTRRLSGLLATAPEAVKAPPEDAQQWELFIPTTHDGRASQEFPGTRGRILTIRLDNDSVDTGFLAAWLNSEQGVASRRRAIVASSSGAHFNALKSDKRSLMRWADELIVPVPAHETQLELASADERLASFQAELSSQREGVWVSPEHAEEVMNRFASTFDDSLTTWFEQLPFPVASALWTAETAKSVGDQLQAYMHAWEALVTFHAAVLLSACRRDPASSADVETAIRQALADHGMGIERTSFGTWVVILERTSKDLRAALESGDQDEIARVRATFGDLKETSIERLVSKDVVRKFNEMNTKRNRWQGHGGHTSEEERQSRVESLVSDLRELRRLLGDVWSQLLLVRAGDAKPERHRVVQSAEVAVGTRAPFATRKLSVGEPMYYGELYLVRDGSQSPLPLSQFVQLRAAPREAQYTTYFYNRTDGPNVRMVSYQYGPESEVGFDAENFREEFGELVPE